MVTDHSVKNPFEPADSPTAGPSSAPAPPDYTEQVPVLLAGGPVDQRWYETVGTLESQIQQYNKATDPTVKRSLGDSVYSTMTHIATEHSDPKIRKLWKKKAKEFQKKRQKKGDNLFIEVGKAFLMLIAGPFLLAGGLTIMVGKVVYGIGTFLIYGRIGDKQLIGRAEVV